MIPRQFNMVNLEWMELSAIDGEVFSGLYSKLLSAAVEENVILYNWKFCGIPIPPYYVKITLYSNYLLINDNIKVKSDDTVTILSLEPVINSITIRENGTYRALHPTVGFNPVIVDVYEGPVIITKDDWDDLSIEEKRALGLAVIQYNSQGFYLGEYVNASMYVPDPELISSYYMNGNSSSSLEHTFDGGDYTVIIACVSNNLRTLSDLTVELNNQDISSSFTQRISRTSPIAMYLASFESHFDENDILTVANLNKSQNCGVQLFIFSNVDETTISYIGSAGNNGSTFVIPQSTSYCFEVAKFGYYTNSSTVPETRLFVPEESSNSTPCPNQTIYWYGGTYAIQFTQ